MMLRIILCAIVAMLLAGNAEAACTPPLAVKDGAGNTVNMSVVQGADGSCQYYIDVDASSRLYNALTSAIPAGTAYIGKTRATDGTNDGVMNPCQTAVPTSVSINISTATTTRLIAPSASNKTYICSMFVISAGTQNVGIVEGTGGTCGTATVGVIGGTTAATGPNLTAQAGWTLGNGLGVVAGTAGTNVDFCFITSAAVQVSGVLTYVQKP